MKLTNINILLQVAVTDGNPLNPTVISPSIVLINLGTISMQKQSVMRMTHLLFLFILMRNKTS